MLLMALFAPWAAQAQETVTIGDGTSSGYYLPFNMFYNYSLTQQIYSADEIGMAGTINTISFQYAYSNPFTLENVQVYMLNVDKSSFESTTDMVAISESDKVFEGTFSATGSGWVTIELDTPFEYDGTSNLLVCCYDPTYSYPGSSYVFNYTSTTDYTSVVYYSDSYTPSLTDVTSFSGNKNRYQYHNNIQLEITPAGSGPTCARPTNFAVSNMTAHAATLTWEGTADDGFNVEYKKATDEEWNRIGISANTWTFDNLDAATAYNVRVQAVCDADNELYSSWVNASFTTECDAYDIPYTYGFEDAPRLPAGRLFQVILHV